jgi:hypothetical protein
MSKVDNLNWYSFRNNEGRIVAIGNCTRSAATKWELQNGTRASLWKEGESVVGYEIEARA